MGVSLIWAEDDLVSLYLKRSPEYVSPVASFEGKWLITYCLNPWFRLSRSLFFGLFYSKISFFLSFHLIILSTYLIPIYPLQLNRNHKIFYCKKLQPPVLSIPLLLYLLPLLLSKFFIKFYLSKFFLSETLISII